MDKIALKRRIRIATEKLIRISMGELDYQQRNALNESIINQKIPGLMNSEFGKSHIIISTIGGN